jgi:archaellum component FlaC
VEGRSLKEVNRMESYGENLKNRIDNVAELSTMCRSEWCRSLESRVDSLEEEVDSLSIGESRVSRQELSNMRDKLSEAYRHLGPDIHV